jgi:hypothetical protein
MKTLKLNEKEFEVLWDLVSVITDSDWYDDFSDGKTQHKNLEKVEKKIIKEAEKTKTN